MRNIPLLGIRIRDGGIMVSNAVDVVVKDIDVRGGELAGADAALEEQVELGEGAALRLGDAEVRVDDAEEADCGLEKKKGGAC